MSNKKTTTTITLVLMFAVAVSLIALPASAQTSWKASYAVIGATPNPVGIGQEVLIWLGITDQVAYPMPGWSGLTVTVQKPDGTTQTLGPFTTDTTGSTGTVFVPTVAGTYYLQTHFPQQVLTVTSAGVPANTTFRASSSEKYPLIVTETPREYWHTNPLPIEFWSRPVDAQFREWRSISGNWLGHTALTGASFNLFAQHNIGPETGHILWAKPYGLGGLVGGELRSQSYDHGDAYEGKWTPPVIISGKLFYNRYETRGAPNLHQEVVAQDLRTGKELWAKNWSNQTLLLGQAFYWDSFNMHGAFAYLWTSVTAAGVTTWHAYDAYTGRWVYSITNIPSGTTIRGPNGDLLRLQINLAQGWMAMWNATKIVNPQITGTFADGSWRPHGITHNATAVSPASALQAAQSAWMWNVTIPTGLPGGIARILEDRVIGANALPFAGAKVDDFRTWGLSLKPGQIGRLLFNTSFRMPPGNLTLSFVTASLEDGVFVMVTKETRQHYGFSIDTGNRIWGPTQSQPYLDAFDIMAAGWNTDAVAYGKLFRAATSGILYTYDIKTGELLWNYSVADTYTEILWSDNWPLKIAFVTDGKIYLTHCEHSPIDPLPRGAPFVCLDVETGKKIFEINLRGHYWGGLPIIGDSIIAMFNTYDNRIYALGKGPTSTMVSAPNVAIQLGSSVVISGAVTDISPGTEEYALKARFPHGVPAVSDDDMSKWMEYVYMQFERPKNVQGVPVTIDVLDANGNYRNIGTAVSDADGFFSFAWAPDIEGKYTVVAGFAGSKSYYPSRALAAFMVDPAPPAPAQPEPAPPSTADMYFVPAVACIIAVLVVVVVLLALLLLKRRA